MVLLLQAVVYILYVLVYLCMLHPPSRAKERINRDNSEQLRMTSSELIRKPGSSYLGTGGNTRAWEEGI